MTIDATDWLGDDAETPPNAGGRPAKDYAARGNRKVACPGCGFAVRTSVAQLRRAGGFPRCACGDTMDLVELRDRFAYDADALQTQTEGSAYRRAYDAGKRGLDALDVARVAWNDVLRELGRLELIVRPFKADAKSGADRMRCRWESGYCSRWAAAGSAYCHEHDPHGQASRSAADVRKFA